MEQGILREYKQYFYLYKITNNINKKYYYGIHCTNDLDDGYMGSGKILHQAYEKYGIENFTKEIIQYCSSLKEVSDLEKEIVNETLINDPQCYNIIKGGYYLDEETLKQIGKFNSKNQTGEKNSQFGKCWIYKDNECKFIPKEQLNIYLEIGWKEGRIIKDTSKIKNANSNRCWVHKGEIIHFIQKNDLDIYLKNGFTLGKQDKKPKQEFKGSMFNKVRVQDKFGNRFTVTKDDTRYLSGELFSILKDKPQQRNFNTIGKVSVKDKNGNTFLVNKDDQRYLSGELVGVNKGRHWKQKKRK